MVINDMSEERAKHPQEPAEGGEDKVEATGADKASDRDPGEDQDAEESSAVHSQDPAEGAEDQVQASGADKSESEE